MNNLRLAGLALAFCVASPALAQSTNNSMGTMSHSTTMSKTTTTTHKTVPATAMHHGRTHHTTMAMCKRMSHAAMRRNSRCRSMMNARNSHHNMIHKTTTKTTVKTS